MMDLQAFASRLGLQTGVELGADSSPVLSTEEEEQVSAAFEGVDLVLGDETSGVGTGSLFVTTRRIIWVSSQPGASVAMAYPQVVMHAISTDPAAFPRPCVYLQLDEGSKGGGGFGGDDGEDEGEEEEEEEPSAELRLVPADAAQVEDLFKALCDCSALNPDTDAEEEGQADLFFDEAEVLAGLPEDTRAEVLAARAQGLGMGEEGDDDIDKLLGDDPDRFEDDEAEFEEGEKEAGAAAGGAAGGAAAGNGFARH